MKKKILTMCLVAALAATAIVGGTLAYFTDTDEKTNEFTLGNIDIELLEDFKEDEAELMPGVDINKDVTIKNIGENDAYVWYTYAAPEALLEATATDVSVNPLHINHAGYSWLGWNDNQKYWQEGQTEALPEDECWVVDWKEERNVKLYDDSDILYRVVTVLYNGILSADTDKQGDGEETAIGLTNVYLDTRVDAREVNGVTKYYFVNKGVETEIEYDLAAGVKIPVKAYGIQAEGLTDVTGENGEKDGKVDVYDAYALYNAQY